MMDNWAKEQADLLKKSLTDKEQKRATFHENQKIIDAQGRERWEEVVKEIARQCKLFNSEIEEKVLIVAAEKGDRLRIHAETTEGTLNFYVNFREDRETLQWNSENGEPSGKYELAVDDNHKAVFQEYMSSANTTPESVARVIISSLIRALSR